MMGKTAAATGPAPARSTAPAFGQRAVLARQGEILRAALAAIAAGRPLAAFDLDSTVLDNRPRQARIVREFGAAAGDERLAACAAAHVVSWELDDTASACGLTPDEAARVLPDLRRFWQERFFTSAYCVDDAATPGAVAFLARARALGARIIYVTGRPEAMREGTLTAFRRAGLPLPDPGAGVELWLKPRGEGDDDAWKVECHRRLQALAGLACAFDNEPTHVNAYKRSFPEAAVVHLDTDHSRRPVEVLADIPSVLDFRLDEPCRGPR